MKLLSALLFTVAAATPVAADSDKTEPVRALQAPIVMPVGPPSQRVDPTTAPVTPPTPAPVTPPTPAPVTPPTSAPVNPPTSAPVTPPTPAPVNPPTPADAAEPAVVLAPVAPPTPVVATTSAPINPIVTTQSIIDLAAADGKYGTLLSAVTNTPGVLDAIAESFPVTIFGPIDDAFSAIADTVSGLDNTALAGVLAGHVVAGVFTAEMVIDAGCVELMTLAGNMVRVMVKDGKVMVNDSTVVQADIIGDGGVIHGVDTVILPGTFMPCPAPATTPITGGGGGKGSKKSSGKGSSSKGMSSGKGSSSKGQGSTKSPSSSGKGSSSKGMSSGKGGKGSRRS